MSYDKLCERISKCTSIADIEGTELGDCINHLCNDAELLHGIGYYKAAQKCIKIAETICVDHIRWCWEEGIDELDRISDELFIHFIGVRKDVFIE